MNIAVFVDAYPTFSETFVRNHVQDLVRRGHQVAVFPRSAVYPGSMPPAPDDGACPRIFYPAPLPPTRLGRRVASLKVFLRLLARNPVRTTRAILARRAHCDSSLLRYLLTAEPMITETFDIAHAHFGPNGYRGLLLKRIQPQVRLVTTFHGYGIRNHLHDGRDYYQNLFKEGDFFLANSRDTGRHLANFGAPLEKLAHLPVGVDFTRLPERPGQPTGDSTILLTVARLSEEKALHVILQALAILRRERPELDWQYRIAGDGPCREELRELACKLQIADRVEFLGAVSHEAVIRLMHLSHIFLLSSVSEGLGLSVLEAQAAYLPVLATHVGGIPEAVVPDRSAFLVPPGDVEALAGRLGWLLDHPERWQEMGRAGRAFVEERYDIERLNDRLMAIYEDLLAGRRP